MLTLPSGRMRRARFAGSPRPHGTAAARRGDRTTVHADGHRAQSRRGRAHHHHAARRVHSRASRRPARPMQTPGRSASFLVELKPDAAPGVYPVRIETPSGISNILLFTLGTFPEVTEEESQPGRAAQSQRHDRDRRARAPSPRGRQRHAARPRA